MNSNLANLYILINIRPCVQVLVRTEVISLDTVMRGWLRTARSYIKPVDIGEVSLDHVV